MLLFDLLSDVSVCVGVSGLVRDPLSGPVQQVSLRCSAGSVRWLFPRLALRLVLKPNVFSPRPAALCVKISRASRGAAVFAERAGELRLLTGGGAAGGQVHCVRADGEHGAVIFLQADPQSDLRRRAVTLRYELLQEQSNTKKGKKKKPKTFMRLYSYSLLLLYF